MTRIIRLAALLTVIALVPSTSSAPISSIAALAPIEIWGDGFGDLRGIAVDADGAVYVADGLAGTVTRIAADRSRATIASGLDRPAGVVFDPSGRIVIAEEHGDRVIRLERDGRQAVITSAIHRPRWLAFATDGTLYVCARASTADGSALAILRLAPSGQLDVLIDGLAGVEGLAVSGDVLYAATTGRSGEAPGGLVYGVTLFSDGTAGPMAPIDVSDGNKRPVGLAVDAERRLFVTTRELAAVFDPSQRSVVTFGPEGSARFAAGLADPRGLAFDAQGNLFLADGSAGRVLKFHAPAPPTFGPMPAYTTRSPVDVRMTSEPLARVVVAGAALVSGPADGAGAITIAVPIAHNAETTLRAWAIGHDGEGLVSSSAETSVIHDDLAPTIVVDAAPAGSTADTVTVRAEVTDAGAGVAAVQVKIDGNVVGSTTTPALPAASVVATAAVNGPTATDGAHTVSVTAMDRAGNMATVTRSLVSSTATSSTMSGPSTAAAPLAAPGGFTLAPTAGRVVQGGTTIFSVTAPESAKGAAQLSVSGLPAGVTASFSPHRVAPGKTAELTVRAAADAATGTRGFTVAADAATLAGQLTVVSGAGTTLVGRVVDTDRRPLAGVAIILDAITVSTDASGNFLMENPPDGDQVVLVDGATANNGQNQYPTIPVSVTIVANRVNELPYVPHLHRQHQRFTPIHPTQKTVVTDSDLPGVVLHLEGGNDVIGWDGQRADKVSIRTVPADRLPVKPLPPGSDATKVYMFYFGKRGGGVPKQPVPFETPNDLGLAPGAKANLWYFDESPRKGEAPNDWRIAGTGTVSADGQTITSDPGVGIPKFCCGSAAYNSVNSGQNQQPGVTPQRNLGRPVADPVDVSTGIFMVSATDLVVAGRVPMAITRSYRSGDTNIGPFGAGTMMGYEEFLQQTSSTVLTYVYHGNARTAFVQQGDGTFVNTTVPAFRGAKITLNADGTRTLRYKSGESVTFAVPAFGVPLQSAVADANGNRLTLARESLYAVTGITDDTGRRLTVWRDLAQTEHVTRVVDGLGRAVIYEYDDFNRLARVTNPAGGVTQYAYDSLHRMTAITDARGITYLTNTYDANYRVCQQSQVDGGVYTLYYVTTDIATTPASLQLLSEAAAGGPISQSPCSSTGSMSPVVATVVIDPRGHPTTYRFNGIGAVVSLTDALGQTTTYQRDAATNLVQAVTDPLNRTTSFTYDANGNVLTVTDPAGNVQTLTYEATFSKVTSVRDPLNHVTSFGYDSHGNLTTVTDPLGHVTTVAYNATGDPTSVTNPLGQTTTFTYDPVGNLVTLTDPLGRVTTRTYDGVSRLLSQANPLGYPTSYAYDLLNRLTRITDPNAGVTAFAYDANGNLLSLTDARGSTTSYTYDTMDRVATRTDPLSHPESFGYDLSGNVSQHTDRKGQIATFTYDALNRRTGATYADATVSYTLDGMGRLTQATDSIGGTITNTYDVLDRLTSQTTGLGTVSYQYDGLGRRTQMTVPNQSPVTYAYDAASRPTSIVQGSNVVQFAYDAANRRTSLILPNGISTQYSYDAGSQLTALIYKLGATTLGDLQYLYDGVGNRIQVGGSWARTGLPQAVASATYNANNQQLTFGSQNLTYDFNGSLTSDGTAPHAWDARNRLAAIAGPVPASFVYDVIGRRSRKTINGATTDYLYDNLNPVQEQSASVTTTLLTALNVDEYIARAESTNTAFFLADVLGSTVALADGAGNVPTSYTYEPFGGTSTTGAPTSNPYDFTGREGDLVGLKYYRARYYDPMFQRFLSEDPLGFAAGDSNLYAYVFNRPLNATDPLGLLNILVGVNGSSVGGTGAEVSAGGFVNFGGGCQEPDLGLFTYGGIGTGVDVGYGGFLGFVFGGTDAVRGVTGNLTISVGRISVSLLYGSNGFAGFTVGAGPTAVPFGGSSTVGVTGTGTLGGFLDKAFGKRKSKSC